MQVINFATLPGVKPGELIPKTCLVQQFLRDNKPDLKAFKLFLREHDLFDKERFEILCQFFDLEVIKGKPIVPSPFLQRLGEVWDPDERKKLIFKHLVMKNQILAKYVMDGLAERLYSTNEMYRFITSYVYPGDYITLVNFRAWMDWLEASEHIKVIGIRWGLSPLGEEGMNIIKLIDVDELLEGDGGDSEDDDDDDDDDEDDAGTEAAATEVDDDAGEEPAEDAPPTPAEIAPPPPTLGAPSLGAPPAQRDGLEPVAAPPRAPAQAPTHATAAAPGFTHGEAQVVFPAGVETVQVVVQPIRPEAAEVPLRLVREAFAQADAEEETDDFGEPAPAVQVRLEQLRLDEETVAENLRAVQAWWQSRPGGRVLTARSYGFSAEAYAAEPSYTLYRLASLAVSLFRFQGRLQVGKGGEAFGILDQMGFFTNSFKSRKGIDAILEALFKGGLGQRPELFSNLHYFLLFRRALKELKDEGVREMAESDGPDLLLGKLWEHLGVFSLHYEILWIARELMEMGAWPRQDLAQVGVVPLPKVRENAFRLGFIETPYATDFPSLVAVSRRLSRFFPAALGWEAPLVYFEPKRVLHYDAAEAAFFTKDQLGID